MTKPKSKRDCGIGDFWKVRIMLPGNAIHVASRSKPDIHFCDGRICSVDMDIIHNTEHGDIIGFIDWKQVAAVSWRQA